MNASTEFDLYCENKLVELRDLSFETLAHMDGKVLNWKSNGRSGTIAIAVEHVDDQTVRVILKGHLPLRLLPFMKHVFVDGFRKHRDGAVELVSKEEVDYYD
jgi:hypothetical protein